MTTSEPCMCGAKSCGTLTPNAPVQRRSQSVRCDGLLERGDMWMKLLSKIEPQPPKGIKYMLGDETWMPQDSRTPLRLQCEEWGNLGPMELNPDIRPNKAGFRVRTTELLAPDGALGFTNVDGIYFWTDTDMYGRTQRERSNAPGHGLAKRDD